MIGKSIELDKMRTLKFDFNAMSDFEDVYGKTLMEILTTGAISFSVIRALLWAGLKHEDRQLAAAGPARAGEIAQEWIEKSGGDAADLSKMVTDALIESGFAEDGDTGPDTTEGDDSGNC